MSKSSIDWIFQLGNYLSTEKILTKEEKNIKKRKDIRDWILIYLFYSIIISIFVTGIVTIVLNIIKLF